MPNAVCHLENDHVSFTLFDDASADLLDRARATPWHMGPVAIQEDGPIDVGHVWLRTGRSIPEQYPGRFRVQVQGDGFRVTVLGRERREVGRFTLHVMLDGPWIEYRLSEVDESLPGLTFPPPLVSESLVVPQNVGRWVRQPLGGRFFWRFGSHLNMRWFGGLRGENGWICIFPAEHHDAGAMAADMHISPAWLKSMGRWSYPRRVRYGFAGGGYVGLAKTFRRWAQEHGLFRSLAEKIEQFPAVANLVGGRILSFMQGNTYHADAEEDRLRAVTPEQRRQDGQVRVGISHADALRIAEDARSMGTRGLVVVRGWIKGGYDDSHPDIWPPEPAFGSVEELKGVCALPDPQIVALHDNYADMYPRVASWPRGVFRSPTGEAMPGGIWAGGQCYIINSRDSLAYAKRNWQHMASLGTRAMFIDTTTAVNQYESYESGNELTRSQDEQYKRALLQFYRDQGQVLGSEESADFGAPLVDWFENRHAYKPGESIPLWPLVYHDAACCGRYVQQAADQAPAGTPNWLADMLWGYFVLWGLRKAADWPAQRDAFSATMHVDRWHARIGLAEMTSHRYLAEDGLVEQTEFSSGQAITCSFAAEPRTVAGRTIAAGGYVLEG